MISIYSTMKVSAVCLCRKYEINFDFFDVNVMHIFFFLFTLKMSVRADLFSFYFVVYGTH